MKISVALLSAFLASSEAFSPISRYAGRTTTTNLYNARADTADMVQEALDASKKFGATSKEAMLAWEAVEEVDASDNSAATMGNKNDECEVDEVSPDCLEYNESVSELQALLDANKPNLATLETIISSSVSKVKLAVPSTTSSPDSPELQAALAEAKKATADKGITSPEAAVAWETVEEIAAAGNSAALGGTLSEDECLLEAASDACAALEELSRVIESRK
jgi:hypothetical protein